MTFSLDPKDLNTRSPKHSKSIGYGKVKLHVLLMLSSSAFQQQQKKHLDVCSSDYYRKAVAAFGQTHVMYRHNYFKI